MATNSGAIVRFPSLTFSTSSDLELAEDGNAPLQREVASIQRTFHTIDIKKAMNSLSRVGSLLQLAYAGSKGFDCCANVVGILSNYQSLITDSVAACSTFVNTSLSALSTHRLAIQIAESGNLKKTQQIMGRCAEMAGAMASTSGELADKANTLCEDSKSALQFALKDETLSIQQRQVFKAQFTEIEAKEAALRSKMDLLVKSIKEEREQEERAGQEAQRADTRAFLVSTLSAIAKPVTAFMAPAAAVVELAARAFRGAAPEQPVDEDDLPKKGIADLLSSRTQVAKELRSAEAALKRKSKRRAGAESPEHEKEVEALEAEVVSKRQKIDEFNSAIEEIKCTLRTQAKSARELQAQSAERRFEFQKDQIESNAQLAASISRLGSLSAQKDELGTAISSLEVSVKTLGKVKNIFEHTRLFWLGVQGHCKSLAGIQGLEDLVDANLQAQVISNLTESGISWLALGKINYSALNAIQEVNAHVSAIMKNLPSKGEASSLISSLSREMNEELALESANIQEIVES